MGEEWIMSLLYAVEPTRLVLFFRKGENRLHIGFDDPSHAVGSEEFIWSEFIRVRDEIKRILRFYTEKIKPQL